MTQRKLSFAPSSRRELQEIYQNVLAFTKSRQSAEKIKNEILDKAEELEFSAHLGMSLEKLWDVKLPRAYFRVLSGKDVIIYTYDEKSFHIDHIVHGATVIFGSWRGNEGCNLMEKIMVRITDIIIYDCEQNAFHIQPLEDFERFYRKMRWIWWTFDWLIILLTILSSFWLANIGKYWLAFIVLFLLPVLAIFVLKITGLIKNVHMGDLMVLPKRFESGDDYRERRDEKNREDKFIYVFETRRNLKIFQNTAPTFPEKGTNARKILSILSMKKQLILNYSLFMNLVALIVYAIFGWLSKLPMVVIPLFFYFLVLTTWGFAPIKSYRFWSKLEKLIQNTVPAEELVSKPIIDYEKIHQEILEEMNNGK